MLSETGLMWSIILALCKYYYSEIITKIQNSGPGIIKETVSYSLAAGFCDGPTYYQTSRLPACSLPCTHGGHIKGHNIPHNSLIFTKPEMRVECCGMECHQTATHWTNCYVLEICYYSIGPQIKRYIRLESLVSWLVGSFSYRANAHMVVQTNLNIKLFRPTKIMKFWQNVVY